jgi:hypothetical protein
VAVTVQLQYQADVLQTKVALLMADVQQVQPEVDQQELLINLQQQIQEF